MYILLHFYGRPWVVAASAPNRELPICERAWMAFSATHTLCIALFSLLSVAHLFNMASSDDECIMPPSVQHNDPGALPSSRRQFFDSNIHTFMVDSDDDEVGAAPVATTAALSVPIATATIEASPAMVNQSATGNSSGSNTSGSADMGSIFSAPPAFPAVGDDRRGKYSRMGGKGNRTAWLPYVHKLATAINTGNLSVFMPTCSSDCPNQGSCFETMTIRVIKCCLEQSFGSTVLLMDHNGQFAQPSNITPNHKAVRQWWDLAQTGRVLDEEGNVSSLTYTVNERPVCLNAWAKIHGVTPTTASSIDRKLRLGDSVWGDASAHMAAMANRTLLGSLVNAATSWWMTRLTYYETVPKRGLILYPRGVIWKDVYAEEFIPEMRLLGFNWKDVAPTTPVQVCHS